MVTKLLKALFILVLLQLTYGLITIGVYGSHGRFDYTDFTVLTFLTISIIFITVVYLVIKSFNRRLKDLSKGILIVSKIVFPLATVILLFVIMYLIPVKFNLTSTVQFIGSIFAVIFMIYYDYLLFVRNH